MVDNSHLRRLRKLQAEQHTQSRKRPKKDDPALTDPAAFRARLLITCDGEPRPLGEICDDWQRRDFEALDPGWAAVVGITLPNNPNPVLMRGYLERSRGHSKTADLAAQVLWVLYASKRKIKGYGAAADEDQAKLLRDEIAAILQLNPWLAEFISANKLEVFNKTTGSRLEIIASDAPSSYGYKPDFIVCDEITHWRNRDLWDSLFSAAAKRKNCMLVIIANAGLGMGQSWQWLLRESCRTHPHWWYFSRLDGPVASWITEDRLAEQEALLPNAAYRRLWLNIWSSGEGDALEPDDIEAAITLRGPITDRARADQARDPGLGEWQFIAGLDLGVKKDRCGLVVLGTRYGSARIRLAYVESWKPPKGGEIELQQVEDKILDVHQRLRISKLRYDPSQAKHMAQRLQRRGIHCEEMTFVGKNLDLMAQTLLQVFRSQIIDLYPCEILKKDLLALTIVEKKWGFKLESARTAAGHADTGIAFAIALPDAFEMAHHRAPREGEPGPVSMSVRRDPKRLGVLMGRSLARSRGQRGPFGGWQPR